MVKLYLSLIVVNLILLAILAVVPYFDSGFYSSDVLAILAWRGFNASFEYNMAYYLVITGLYFVASVGLALFKSWGKNLFLGLTIAGILASPFMGLQVALSWESTVAGIMTYIDGFLLCMIYFTSLAKKF